MQDVQALDSVQSVLPATQLAVGAMSGGVAADPMDGVVSFHAELPEPIQQAMTSFIERYPNWDQYRLIQAALAGFLVQNGVESREITRLYVGNMFRRQSLLQGV